MSPMECVRLLQKFPPSLAMLRRLAAGFEEFQDAWFGLCLEFGMFVEILKVLHRLYLAPLPEPDVLLTVLHLYSIIFDAVWKSVLVTHGSVPVLLLHLSSSNENVVESVLSIVLQIVRIPEAGVCVFLKALSTRQKMTSSPARLGILYDLIVKRRNVIALRVVNTLIDQMKTQDRQDLRTELFALHEAGAKAFIEVLNEWPEMGKELDLFLDALKEDKGKAASVLSLASSSGPPSGSASPQVGVKPRSDSDVNAKRPKSGSKIKKDLRTVSFDVISMPPLVKLRKRDLKLKIGDAVNKVTRYLVSEFDVEPALDYLLMYLAEDGKTPIWLDQEKKLCNIAGLKIDGDVCSTTLYFSLKPVPMTICFPSGESRTVSLVLESLASEVLVQLKNVFSDLPEGQLYLAIG